MILLLLFTLTVCNALEMGSITTNDYVFNNLPYAQFCSVYPIHNKTLKYVGTCCDHCSVGGTGTGNVSVSENWIALIDRGTCEFLDKVQNAYRIGALGVIIINYYNYSIVMDGEAYHTIPTISVPNNTGQLLRDSVYISILPKYHVGGVAQIVVIILVVLFLVIGYGLCYYRIRDRRITIVTSEERPLLYNAAPIEMDSACTICLDSDNDNVDNWVTVQTCNHGYHEKCLQNWLHNDQSCPLCRSKMT